MSEQTKEKQKDDSAVKTERIRVYGIVQGVGFRPVVSLHAKETGIYGTVCNRGPYVEIQAQGTKKERDAFVLAVKERPPKRAEILRIEREPVTHAEKFETFSIIESRPTSGEIYIPPDIAICEDCERELFDPKDRRYLHPFINCTQCGPRLTIIEELPYDRERTSMKAFPMCKTCSVEYYSPKSRRFDAQPVCCPDCGPTIYLLKKNGERGMQGEAALKEARKVLAEGGIVAIKGIGGFHLACRADDENAVARLRKLKKRPAKPFAVMMRDREAVLRECVVSEAEWEIVTGHRKPILLLSRKEGGILADSVAPGNPKVGVMLPYAPVQHLLFRYPDENKVPDILVMTSGNVSGAPICRDDADALKELAAFSDCILSHDRSIRTRCDDSVMDMFRGKPYMIRRSRGYAPLPVYTDTGKKKSVLAIGGELKNTFCVGKNALFYPSSYIGDLADVRSGEALKETIERFLQFLRTQPDVIACDLHPVYRSTAIAKELAEKYGAVLYPVQHHFAHIVSCMAEHDATGPVIGASFDGTGYGTDGTIWGGEILLCTRTAFTRLSHIVPFTQVGGDIASKEGWRIALSMLGEILDDPEATGRQAAALNLCDEKTAKTLDLLRRKNVNSVRSTSCGRLFDAVSAFLGICTASTFEGEASTALEFAAEHYVSLWESLEKAKEGLLRGDDAFPIGELLQKDRLKKSGELLCTVEIVKGILSMRRKQADPKQAAFLFHVLLAQEIAAAIVSAGEEKNVRTAALSGGCFQNRLLLELTVRELECAGFKVLFHHLIPPNDGGIALGQAVCAACEE